MATLLIKNARILDPSRGFDAEGAIAIEDGKLVTVGGAGLSGADRVIDARGLLAVPGLVDMHVHLREPGREDKETIATGAAAAVTGGFTSIACMPNTTPPLDQEALVHFVAARGREAGLARVYPVAAVTKGIKGEELSEMANCVRGGAVAFSDDGLPVRSAELMRRAFQYAKMLDRTIIQHAEDRDLTAGGVMNEGPVATRLGLKGMPRVAEEIVVARDIALARVTGGRYHVAHVSVAETVERIAAAKQAGLRVTAEVAPHHLVLTDEALAAYDPAYKMNPPLRTAHDVEALRKALREGVIDAIASDHAPHTIEEKELELVNAPFGIVGLETTLAVILTDLVAPGLLSLERAIEALTARPARILGIPRGTLAPGADADITLIDLQKEWTIDPREFKTKGRSTPFAGRKVRGRAVVTIVGGSVLRARPEDLGTL
jgi:dihydroorotase